MNLVLWTAAGVPAAPGLAPVRVPVTALCRVPLTAGAMITHGRRGESASVLPNLCCPAVAAFVAWGRFA
ncbi:hypothetical protein ACF073_13335 [Streptomyces sp. NPDC015171]|uniref:hypothetical protein n=1 Tax=Streptomyces sp. NPDC015171 TaxID=3364945 RepID=UPI0036F6F064